MFKNFSEFNSFCKELANKLETLVESHEYPKYGWSQITFMTDHFGGVYAIFHYDLNTNKITYMYGHPEETDITDKNVFISLVKDRLNDILEHRNLEEISDFINSQY